MACVIINAYLFQTAIKKMLIKNKHTSNYKITIGTELQSESKMSDVQFKKCVYCEDSC